MLNVWMAAFGVLLAYAGCVLLFQSGERRAAHPAVCVAKEKMRPGKLTGWALALGALGPLSLVQGIERGLALWLGLLACAGMASLLLAALVPHRHMISIAVAGILSAAIAAIYMLIGAAP